MTTGNLWCALIAVSGIVSSASCVDEDVSSDKEETFEVTSEVSVVDWRDDTPPEEDPTPASSDIDDKAGVTLTSGLCSGNVLGRSRWRMRVEKVNGHTVKLGILLYQGYRQDLRLRWLFDHVRQTAPSGASRVLGRGYRSSNGTPKIVTVRFRRVGLARGENEFSFFADTGSGNVYESCAGSIFVRGT